MTEAEKMMGLKAVLGMVRSTQQPAGQLVDIGHGYKAFVQTPGVALLGDALMGAAGGGVEGALEDYMRERNLADQKQVRDEDFGRRLDFLDAEQGYRAMNAEEDHARGLERMDYGFGLEQTGAEADQGRRLALMDQEFALRERGADSDQKRRLDLYGRERDDKVAESLASMGITPSAYPDTKSGLDALAAEAKGVDSEDRSLRRAAGIARLMDGGLSLEQAQTVMGGGAAPAGMGGGAQLVNPPGPREQALAKTSDSQQRLLEHISALKLRDEKPSGQQKINAQGSVGRSSVGAAPERLAGYEAVLKSNDIRRMADVMGLKYDDRINGYYQPGFMSFMAGPSVKDPRDTLEREIKSLKNDQILRTARRDTSRLGGMALFVP